MRRSLISAASILAVAALALTPGPAAAQEILFTLRADGAQPIQAAPPGGLLRAGGRAIGATTAGQTYGVTQLERQSAGLGGRDIWVRIVPIGPDGTVMGDGGWAAYGSEAFEPLGTLATPYGQLLED